MIQLKSANNKIILCGYSFDNNYYYLSDKSERLSIIGGTSGPWLNIFSHVLVDVTGI